MQLWNKRPPAHPFSISFFSMNRPETLKADAGLGICLHMFLQEPLHGQRFGESTGWAPLSIECTTLAMGQSLMAGVPWIVPIPEHCIYNAKCHFCVLLLSRILFMLTLTFWQFENFLMRLYSISQEICTRLLLCCALLWLYIDWFSHIHQAYFTGTVAI